MSIDTLVVNPPLGCDAVVHESAPALGVYDAQWEANFKLYQEFKAEHGREPPVGEVYRGKNLGIWCKTQRDLYHRRTLPAERLRKLTDVGFAFGLYEKAWQDSFRAYVAFKAEHGREPSSSGGPVEEKLARWCMVQRRAYKSNTLLVEREQLLLDAGFVFKQHDARWQAHFEVYVAFKKEHGREPSAYSIFMEEKRLFAWMTNQRSAYRAGNLSPYRVQKLMEIGFEFGYQKTLEGKIAYAIERSVASKGESCAKPADLAK